MAKTPSNPTKKRVAKPKRAPGPYAIFVRSMKGSYQGDFRAFSKFVAGKWKELSEDQKNEYRKQAADLQAKSDSPCKGSKCSRFLQFYKAAYTCLRRQHPDWSSEQVKEEVMKNYKARTCPCQQ